MIKRIKENNKKGFTLVELIVVLVILAILAAMLIPALTGYIDKAKEKDVIAETRQVVMAAQTLVDEAYAKVDIGSDTVKIDGEDGTVKVSDIATLAEVDQANIGTITVTNGKVTVATYTKSGKTCTYNPANSASNSDGDYNVTKTTP